MQTLETQALFNAEYDTDDYDTFEDIVRALADNIGYKDNRRDKRFIVKFHDIIYEPDEDTYNKYFGDFCDWVYINTMDTLADASIVTEDLLTSYTVGHYRAFKVYIPEITKDNIYELAKKIYDETQDPDYVDNYITTTNLLQEIEDNYVDWWKDYINE